MFKALFVFVKANPLLASAITVGIGALLKSWWSVIESWLWRQFSICLTIKSADPAFDWFNIWVADQNLPMKSISVGSFHQWRKKRSHEPEGPPIHFTFAPGWHVFRYRGRRIIMNRHIDENTNVLSWFIPETLTLRTFGRNSKFLMDFLRECRRHVMEEDKDTVKIFIPEGSDWRQCAAQPKRSMDSVILPNDQRDVLVKDCNRFSESEEWYAEMNIPYQRGYLFYGPPGTGKTTVVKALASHKGCSLYVLDLNDKAMSDKVLFQLMGKVPPNELVLLEDVDAAFAKREAADKDSGSSVTFSGLLNAIDGVFSSHARTLAMTTNHIELLDPALIRPGRVDMQIALGYATKEQIRDIYKKFYTAAHDDHVSRYQAVFSDVDVTMAELQGEILKNLDCGVKAIEAARLFVETKTPQVLKELVNV